MNYNYDGISQRKYWEIPFFDKKEDLGEKIFYGHLFNCAVLQSDKVAKLYGVALNYKILPFCLYIYFPFFQLKKNSEKL